MDNESRMLEREMEKEVEKIESVKRIKIVKEIKQIESFEKGKRKEIV